jgi:hypothetical protein
MAAGFCASACHQAQNRADSIEKAVVAEKPFVAGGSIDMQLDGGDYEVRPAADNHIRVTFSGNTGHAKVELTADGMHAGVHVKALLSKLAHKKGG